MESFTRPRRLTVTRARHETCQLPSVPSLSPSPPRARRLGQPRARAATCVSNVAGKAKGASRAPPRFSARASISSLRVSKPPAAASRRASVVVTAAANEDGEKVPFGYTRADVLLIGVGVTVAGCAAYYGLQANGVSAIWAGNIVQLTFVGGLSIAWIGSYIARVMNKDMTYVKQLKDYEDAVMAKRLEELPEAELAKMMEDISKLDPK